MGTLIDPRTSQNISMSGKIAIPLSSTPARFGILPPNHSKCWT